MSQKALKPAAKVNLPYTIPPDKLEMRASELPEITSVTFDELFPGFLPSIPLDRESVRAYTVKAMEKIDLSRVKPTDSVNMMASHHGFTVFGGEPYAEMLRTVRDEIERRTGTSDIRLKSGNGFRLRESEAYIKKFHLDEYFHGKAYNCSPLDRGITIQTKIGPQVGLKAMYDATWCIHVHNTDPREVHFHRLIDRILKPFAMSFARVETRSSYHYNMGPRGGNLTARAIYESDFVQSKLLGSCVLCFSPNGVIDIDADSDLLRLNNRITKGLLSQYGRVTTLLNEIDDVIAILDCPGPVSYVFAGGIVFGAFLSKGFDIFDLDNVVIPFTKFSTQCYDADGNIITDRVPPISKNIRAMINNYSYKGYPCHFFASNVPSIIVGDEMARLMEFDEQNYDYRMESMIAPSLPAAVNFTRRITGCDKFLVFDGAQGGFNCSESLREEFLARCGDVGRKVDEELLPKWLAQRGIVE